MEVGRVGSNRCKGWDWLEFRFQKRRLPYVRNRGLVRADDLWRRIDLSVRDGCKCFTWVSRKFQREWTGWKDFLECQSVVAMDVWLCCKSVGIGCQIGVGATCQHSCREGCIELLLRLLGCCWTVLVRRIAWDSALGEEWRRMWERGWRLRLLIAKRLWEYRRLHVRVFRCGGRRTVERETEWNRVGSAERETAWDRRCAANVSSICSPSLRAASIVSWKGKDKNARKFVS